MSWKKAKYIHMDENGKKYILCCKCGKRIYESDGGYFVENEGVECIECGLKEEKQ